jgi:hypothetical protein
MLGDPASAPARRSLYVWKNYSEMRNVLHGSDYQKLLRVSADAAANAKPGTDIDTLTNQTAVLVAAATMLGRA